MLVFFDHLLGPGGALRDDLHDLSVDLTAHLFRVRSQVLSVSETDEADSLAHAQLGNYVMCDLVSFLEVIRCAIGGGAVKILLCAPATLDEAYLVDELAASVQLVLIVEVLREAQ